MHGLKINHVTYEKEGTGASLFLFEQGAVGAYHIAGSASATHELAVLDPEHSVPNVHGLLLSGGSTYGLFAAEGMVRYLNEKNIGFDVPHGKVPLVPAAALYDLNYLDPVAPKADDVYDACLAASENNLEKGNVGAGTGATVGKIIQNTHCMKGGLGRASIKLDSGLEVIAYAAVNAVGDINDNGKLLAGARFNDGGWVDTYKSLASGAQEKMLFSAANTTLVSLFTNAALDKAALKRIAKMSVAGFARAITPVFSPYDGDVVFCFSIGSFHVSEIMLGTIAAEQVRLAIVDAVQHSEIL